MSGRRPTNAQIMEELERMRRENQELREEQRRREESSSTNTASNVWKLSGSDARHSIPRFYPPCDPCRPSKWIKDIEVQMRVNSWDSQQTRFYASDRLRGAAEKWYEARHGELVEWEEFKNGFLRAFPEVLDFGEVHEKLMKRKKKTSETLEDYVYDVQCIAMSAEMNDQQIRKYVLSGLDDAELRGMVSGTNQTSIPDLLKELREAEIILKDARRRDDHNETKNGPPEKKRRFTSRDSKFDKMHTGRGNRSRAYESRKVWRNSDAGSSSRENPNRKNPIKKDLTCYKCGKKGHFQRNCTSKSDFQLRVMEQVITPRNEFEKPVVICGTRIIAFLDLGAECSVVRESCVRRLKLKCEPCDVNLKGFGNGGTKSSNKVKELVELDGVKEEVTLYVVPDQVQDVDVLLGRDFVDKPNLELVKRYGSCQVKRLNQVSQTPDMTRTREAAIIPPEMIKINPDLPTQVRDKIKEIINNYRVCFATNMRELGQTDIISMKISLKSDEVVAQKPRRVDYGRRAELDKIIEEMLELRIIEVSESQYASPIVLTQKKDGTLRMCVDYRELNSKTIREVYPVPNIEEQLNDLSGMKYYTALDLKSGYYQIKVDPASRHYTAFVTPTGHYQFTRVPFGLTNSPATFMRAMDQLVRGMDKKNIMIFMDDILIATVTIEKNLEVLIDFLSRLQISGMTLNMEKCEFLKTTVNYLGHKLNEEGMRPGDCKVKCVKEFPQPKEIRDVRRFLGLTGYFRKFVPNFSLIARPLTLLLKKDAKFIWADEQQGSFQKLREILCAEPVLTLYNPELEHELHTDACSHGIGGVLIQVNKEGNRQPVAYYSRCTTPAEAKSHSYELETLALVESLERFKYYLANKHFTVYTDCHSLKMSATKKDLMPKIARWLLRIQEYDFDLQFRPGSQMLHADALSRYPVIEGEDGEPVAHKIYRIAMEENDWIATLQNQDGDLKRIRMILDGELINQPDTKGIEKDYVSNKGRLYRRTELGLRFVVPLGLRYQVIHAAHNQMAHQGLDRTVEYLRKTYWFPRMSSTVNKFIQTCIQCLYNKRGKDETRYQLHTVDPPTAPFQVIHIDHCGPFPRSSAQNEEVIGIVDAFTKFVILRAVRNKRPRPVLKMIEDVSEFVGMPAVIVSDRGGAFLSKDMKAFCEKHAIQHSLTAARTPRGNGHIERCFQVVNRALMSMSEDPNGRDWDKHLRAVQWSMNSMRNRVTGVSPQELLLSYHPRNILGNQLTNCLLEDIDDNKKPVEELRQEMIQRVIQQRTHLTQKYNATHRAPSRYSEGDLVLIKADHPATGSSRKLLTRYKGPYVVSKVLGADRYEIKDTEAVKVSRRPFLSIQSSERMKKWPDLEDFSVEMTESDEEDDE